MFITVGPLAINASAITEVYDSQKQEKYPKNKVAVTVLGRPFGEDYEFEDAQADEFRRQFYARANPANETTLEIGDQVIFPDGSTGTISKVRGEFIQYTTTFGYITGWLLPSEMTPGVRFAGIRTSQGNSHRVSTTIGG